METKAAKTLAIIVGGFIVCWFPFFTMYVVRAFCPDCIHPVLFSVLFWLGYCNSAINPLIYALFSKDFRYAFKRIICRYELLYIKYFFNWKIYIRDYFLGIASVAQTVKHSIVAAREDLEEVLMDRRWKIILGINLEETTTYYDNSSVANLWILNKTGD